MSYANLDRMSSLLSCSFRGKVGAKIFVSTISRYILYKAIVGLVWDERTEKLFDSEGGTHPTNCNTNPEF